MTVSFRVTGRYPSAVSIKDAPVLVARRIDTWLVGWLAVAVWAGTFIGHRLHLTFGSDITGAVFWVGAVVTAAHFGLSYHLAYGLGSHGVRARRTALTIVPLVLAAALTAICVWSLANGRESARTVVTWSLTSVYVLTTWHYVKQVYGIGRLAAAFAGVKLGAREVHVLRFGLYPLAWLGGVAVLLRGANYSLAGYIVGVGFLPHEIRSILRLLVALGAIAIGIVFVRLRRRGPLPALLVAPYLAAFLWLAVPSSPVVTVLLLAPMHALQYLAIGHRAEIAVARGAGQPTGPSWWLNIALAATCGGLLLSRWVPNLLDRWTGTADQPLLFAALFFVGLNMHHYLIDATIWRSSGQLVRAVARPACVAAHPLPARVVAPPAFSSV
jgi:hypothetical protein